MRRRLAGAVGLMAAFGAFGVIAVAALNATSAASPIVRYGAPPCSPRSRAPTGAVDDGQASDLVVAVGL